MNPIQLSFPPEKKKRKEERRKQKRNTHPKNLHPSEHFTSPGIPEIPVPPSHIRAKHTFSPRGNRTLVKSSYNSSGDSHPPSYPPLTHVKPFRRKAGLSLSLSFPLSLALAITDHREDPRESISIVRVERPLTPRGCCSCLSAGGKERERNVATLDWARLDREDRSLGIALQPVRFY